MAFTVATITFCFTISVFFSKAKLAAAAGGLIYFTFYLPYPTCYTFEEYMTTWQKGIAVSRSELRWVRERVCKDGERGRCIE